MLSNQFIEKVLNATDITELIGKDVDLKKKGIRHVGLCPFHKEKTPSFMVTPSMGLFYCQGCKTGGNAITYLMQRENIGFREAVLQLAKKSNIPVPDEKEPTEKERQEHLHKEALLILLANVHTYYKEQYKQNTQAQDYVKSRWNEDFAQSIGIGYAPKGNTLLQYARKAALNIDLLLEVGLIRQNEDHGSHYDMLRERIIIPIYDKSGRVIAFTARDLTGKRDTPKYINSSNSLIYKKEHSIFGINYAYRSAIQLDKIYLVEGAPDVIRLHQIGHPNTVASLGSAWSESQFTQIKKLTNNICFIPDADPVKAGEEFPAGTRSVMNYGVQALKMGFNVTVLEIPNGEGNTKNDPDTYFKAEGKFRTVDEEDYINWYARRKFAIKKTNEEQYNVVREVANLIVQLDDETKEEMYLSSLKESYKDTSVWRKAIKFARRKKQLDKDTEKTSSIDRTFLSKYGFTVQDGGYYAYNNQEIQWSNFTMQPMFHIRDSINPKRMYRITNQSKQEEIIEMKQEDLISLNRFRQKVEGIGNFIWEAGEKELIKLKKYLYENTDTAYEIIQLGQQKQGFYAFGNGIFDGQFHPTDEYGIVRLKDEGNYYLPASSRIYAQDEKLFQFERRFVHLNYNNITLNEFAKKMIGVFGDNAKVGICFLLATLFRDIITSYTKSFPILNLFGPKGAGKSELGHTLMSFFIPKNNPPNISNSTIAAMADAVAQCANAIVHLDEFKNNIDLDKREFLKGLWDGTGRSRMNMDRDKKREITQVDSGVVVSGQEMATADIALFSRFIFLSFNKTEFTRQEAQRFDELARIQGMGLTHLTLQILSHRAKMEQGFIPAYKLTIDDLQQKLQNEVIEDRILRNWVTPLAALRVLENYIELPFAYKDLINLFTEGIIRQNKECKSNNELANFWNVVAYLQQEGEIFIDSDYRIDHLMELKTNKAKLQFLDEVPVLMIRRNRIFMLYKKFGRMVGDTVLPEGSLRYYLENSKEYLGMKNSVRFKDIRKGYEAVKSVENPLGGTEMKKTSSIDMAMCFDYRKIMENYGIDINVYTDQ